jgi:uncharacterized protein YkwD
MKKLLLCLSLLLLIYSNAFALNWTEEKKAIKMFDLFIKRVLDKKEQTEKKEVLTKKMELLSEQINNAKSTNKKKFYQYLQHLYCEKRALVSGVPCDDNFYINTTLTTNTETLSMSALRRIIAEEHSRRRENQWLLGLKISPTLNIIAQKYAEELCKVWFITHELEWSTLEKRYKDGQYDYEWAGENLAIGQNTIGSLLDQLTTSPGHRANIYQSWFTHIGVGHCDDIWVINYGATFSKT